jgi:lysophospholipase L1-like esterase
MRSIGRRLLRWVSIFVAGFALLLGVEAGLSFGRGYPLTAPKERIRGFFGSPSLPPLKFVVLGDSTAVGVGTTPDKSFPWLLAQWLGERFRVELEVVGVSGARIKDVAAEQVDEALALKPDLMLVEIGANDVTHVTPISAVHSGMAKILDRLSKADSALVVAGPPHMGTSRAIAQPLRTLSGWRGNSVRRAIEAEVKARKIDYVDLAAGTHDKFNTNPARYYSADWFHPGAGGYKLWAEVMYPAVLKAAEERVTTLADTADRAQR